MTAVAPAEIQMRYTGAAATGNAQNNPAASLGGHLSSTQYPQTGGVLFDAVGAGEAAAGDTEYRCLAIFNDSDTETPVVKVWRKTPTTSPNTEIQIGLDPATVDQEPQTVANEGTAPVGVAFGDFATEGAALALDAIPPNKARYVWFKRTVTAGASPLAADQTQLTVSFES